MAAHSNIANHPGSVEGDPNAASFKGRHEFTVVEVQPGDDMPAGYMASFSTALGEEEIGRFNINGDGTRAIEADDGDGYDRIFMTGNFARRLATYGLVEHSEVDDAAIPDDLTVGSFKLKIRVGMRMLETLSDEDD